MIIHLSKYNYFIHLFFIIIIIIIDQMHFKMLIFYDKTTNFKIADIDRYLEPIKQEN